MSDFTLLFCDPIKSRAWRYCSDTVGTSFLTPSLDWHLHFYTGFSYFYIVSASTLNVSVTFSYPGRAQSLFAVSGPPLPPTSSMWMIPMVLLSAYTTTLVWSTPYGTARCSSMICSIDPQHPTWAAHICHHDHLLVTTWLNGAQTCRCEPMNWNLLWGNCMD